MVHDILIVDDEADIRMLVAGILEDEGYRPREAGDGESALAAVAARRPSLVILDVWLEGSDMDGLEVLAAIRDAHADLPVVMISGHGTIETAVSAIRLGAYDFIEKPFQADRLLVVAARAIEAAQLRRENAELRQRTGNAELIGRSPAISQLRHAIDRVAPTGSRVLVTGPAGTGKDVVARLLHQRSPRDGAPYVVVNCAAMSPERMEADLFGVEGGDDGRRVGLFERADGGSLILDEVADMPLETQGKIVRVLQDQTFHRLGGDQPVAVDVRVIAVSARDLQAEIQAKNFREDLYYRLNVVPLTVVPLRERREDIPDLVTHFMERAAGNIGRPARPVAEDAMAALQAYDWPGNVRQLRNIVEWLLIMAPGEARDPVRADMLPPEIIHGAPPTLRMDRASEVMALSLREAREVFEREYLIAQLSRFGGNISRTASFVGMERSALHRKLKLLGIQYPVEK